ncbi:hypothetical protein CN176_05125, partial [Sinorhizobium medicae]
CGNTIVTTREAFENIRVRQRHNSLGTLLGEAIRVSSWLSRCNRLHLHIEQQRMRILTPRGHDWTHRFPAIEAAARNVHLRPIILLGALGSGKTRFASRLTEEVGAPSMSSSLVEV